jgi:hypothetical protein
VITDVAAPRASATAHAVHPLDTLWWTSVPRADRYVVELFDPNGAIVWEREGEDTSVVLPAVLASRSAGSLRWRVRARIGFDRWVESEFMAMEFEPVPVVKGAR